MGTDCRVCSRHLGSTAKQKDARVHVRFERHGKGNGGGVGTHCRKQGPCVEGVCEVIEEGRPLACRGLLKSEWLLCAMRLQFSLFVIISLTHARFYNPVLSCHVARTLGMETWF